MSEVNLNEGVSVVVEDATVITTPIDDTLTISGDAADAKAVGDALALKADKSELSAQVTVNGQSADAQGAIIVTGSDIPTGTGDNTKLDVKIAAIDGKTGEDIPLSGAVGAPSIASAIADSLSVAADEIPLEEDSQTTVKDELERLDSEKGTVKTVNGQEPGSNGNVQVAEVAYARNLISDASRAAAGTFVERLSGGGASLGDGQAYLQQMRGAMTHTGVIVEVLDPTVTPETSDIAVTSIDSDTFFSEVQDDSGTIEFSYTTGWDTDPATYGITFTGTPADGDKISVAYVRGNRGTITVATPTGLTATGWNLYNHSNQYARVLAYDYKYHVGGAYTALAYSATPSGNQTAITPDEHGSFTVPADGYVHVTGGNSSSTYITPEWSDWTAGPSGTFEAYNVDSISLSSLMGSGNLFQYGLMAVGNTYDVIDFEMGVAVSRIDRWEYNAENIAEAIASGRAYDADEDYIYIVKDVADSQSITTMDSTFSASDHGMETINGTEIGVYCLILYGNNLKNKLERDVVTISQQSLSDGQKTQVQTNLGLLVKNNLTTTDDGCVLDAKQGKALKDLVDGKLNVVTLNSVSANGNRTYTLSSTARVLLCAVGASTSKNVFIVNNASGTVSVIGLVGSGSSVISAESSGSNKVKLTNTGANGAGVYALVLQGTIEG